MSTVDAWTREAAILLCEYFFEAPSKSLIDVASALGLAADGPEISLVSAAFDDVFRQQLALSREHPKACYLVIEMLKAGWSPTA